MFGAAFEGPEGQELGAYRGEQLPNVLNKQRVLRAVMLTQLLNLRY